MMKQSISFINVPPKKPRNEPMADLRAAQVVCPYINSPINAPKNGPSKIPQGPNQEVNTPTTNPTVLPQLPYFVPPKRWVPIAGRA